MAQAQYTLYQFPISHYCEKARWALEFKGIEHTVTNLVPGPHRKAMKKLGASHTYTPVLTHGEKVIQGSEEIIDYLESKQKHPPLTPTDPQAASMAHEWARFADRNIGIPLRQYFYFHILANRKLATQLLTEDCRWWSRPLFAIIFPGIRAAMRSGLKINPQNAVVARETLLRSLGHISERIADRRYLVDSRFTRADLAVVALLAPCWRDIPALPAELEELIRQMNEHEGMIWAKGIYANHRTAT